MIPQITTRESPASLLAKLLTVDGTGSGLDADTTDGFHASQTAAAATIVVADGSGKIDASWLPASVLGALQYQGTWNANTNSPTITGGAGTTGHYYVVSTAGTTSIDGTAVWNVGDWIAFNGTTWDKIDAVQDVMTGATSGTNGASGAVPQPLAGEEGYPLLGGGTWGGDLTGVTSVTSTGRVTGSTFSSDAFEGTDYIAYTQGDNTSATAFLSFVASLFRGARIEYAIARGTTKARVGCLNVIHINGTVTIDDQGTDESAGGALGITWTAAVNGANIEVRLAVDNSSTDDVFLSYMARVIKVYAP